MSISLKDGGRGEREKQPVELTVRYRNVSTNETIFIHKFLATAVDVTYSFHVISPTGKDISPVPPKWSSGSGADYPVAPGCIKAFEINLSELCKFDEIGAYKVIVKKMVLRSNRSGWFTVVSNALTIDVSE